MGEMLDRILEGLNDAQREAVLTARGPLAILAGAGTGKTTTVTRRIAAQVTSGAFGADELLAVTFSVKAAGELRERLAKLGVSGVRAMTFHAEALAQYRRFVDQETQIIGSKARLLLDLVRRLPAPHRFLPLREFATEIEWAKNRRIPARDYLERIGDHQPPVPIEHMHRIYIGYEKAKRRRNAIDFEDLLEHVVAHLAEHDRDLGIVRSRYSAFTVDEYQDVNLLQQSLLETWLGSRDELCVVGDDYQSIYSFTGATPAYLLRFEDRFPNASIVTLTDNHRSTPEIIAVANRLVPHLGGSGKRLRATRASGPAPKIHVYASGDDERTAIVKAIRAELTAGTDPNEIAILFRINARTEPFEEALLAEGIAYQVKDGAFLHRPAARAFLARCRQHAPEDVSVVALVEAITDDLGFDPDPDDGLGDDELSRQQDLGRIRAFAATTATGTLEAFATELHARFDSDSAASGVNLLTLHGSKGLEFEVVFLPELEDGTLPISHAKTPEQLAEERRLLYVGITRARRRLELSRAVSRPEERRKQPRPSRFLAELSDAPAATAPAGKVKVAKAPRPSGDPRFEALRGWRAARARAQGVPAYIVFPDSTLIEIATRMPTTREELRSISGVGPLKMSRYGDDLLEVLGSVRAS